MIILGVYLIKHLIHFISLLEKLHELKSIETPKMCICWSLHNHNYKTPIDYTRPDNNDYS